MSRASKVIASMRESLSGDQKLKIIKKKGSILKLLKPVNWKGEKKSQIMTDGIEKSKNIHGEVSYKIVGDTFDSEWANSLEGLVAMIDWKDYEARKAFSK